MAVLADRESLHVARRRVDGLARAVLHGDGVDAHGRAAGIGQEVEGASVRREAGMTESRGLVRGDEHVAAGGSEICEDDGLGPGPADQRDDAPAVRRGRSESEQAGQDLRERKRIGGSLRTCRRRRGRDLRPGFRVQSKRAQGNRRSVADGVEEPLSIAREATQDLISGCGIDRGGTATLLVHAQDPAPAVEQADGH